MKSIELVGRSMSDGVLHSYALQWGGCLSVTGYGETRQEACQSAKVLFKAAVALYFGREARA